MTAKLGPAVSAAGVIPLAVGRAAGSDGADGPLDGMLSAPHIASLGPTNREKSSAVRSTGQLTGVLQPPRPREVVLHRRALAVTTGAHPARR